MSGNHVAGPMTRRSIACNFCRSKKVRCNGGNPCSNCLDHHEACTSASGRRSRLRTRESERNAMAKRLARVEQFINATSSNSSIAQLRDLIAQDNPGVTRPETQLFSTDTLQLQNPPIDAQSNGSTMTDSFAREVPFLNNDADVNNESERADAQVYKQSHRDISNSQKALIDGSPQHQDSILNYGPPQQVDETYTMDAPLELMQVEPPTMSAQVIPFEGTSMTFGNHPEVEKEVDNLYLAESLSMEYHGPRSFLSICSAPGIQWVTEKIGGSPDFQHIGPSLVQEISRQLKIERKLSTSRAPEPEPEDVWRFVAAYFEEAGHIVFGIVNRQWFESRLRAHLENPSRGEDSSWTALRNIIYAYGCRIVLSKTTTFQNAYRRSWAWFENALSVHSDIIYFKTSVVGVQALTLMAYFTDDLASPCLEYMLSSNALRLACSKGFHRQASASWNLSKEESCHRNWIFWALYCLDKSIASRSGRPSVIDDDEINCNIPTWAAPGASVNIVYCDIVIRLSQMLSLVAKKLSTATALHQRREDIVQTVVELDQQLRALASSIQHIMPLEASIDPSILPKGINLNQALYLQYLYFHVATQIHIALTYPWPQAEQSLNQDAVLRDQFQTSSNIVANASRAIIIATKHLHIDVNSPVPTTFFMPLYAAINLFIHILQTQDSSSVMSDMALLDIAAGHFARLEFVTDSAISFPFIKDIAALARANTKRVRTASTTSSRDIYVSGMRNQILPPSYSTNTPGVRQEQEESEKSKNNIAQEPITLSAENWSTFIPLFDPDESMTEIFGEWAAQ